MLSKFIHQPCGGRHRWASRHTQLEVLRSRTLLSLGNDPDSESWCRLEVGGATLMFLSLGTRPWRGRHGGTPLVHGVCASRNSARLPVLGANHVERVSCIPTPSVYIPSHAQPAWMLAIEDLCTAGSIQHAHWLNVSGMSHDFAKVALTPFRAGQISQRSRRQHHHPIPHHESVCPHPSPARNTHFTTRASS
jgi:hypothetical protein